MPRLQGGAQFEVDAAGREVAVFRKAKLEVRRKPRRLEPVAGLVQLRDHVIEVKPNKVRQEEAIVQFGAPARQPRRRIRRSPEARDESAQQQLLGEAHARVGRHLEGAHFEQPEAAGCTVRRIELVDAKLGTVRIAGDVDEQMAHQAVEEPGRARVSGRVRLALHLAERDFDFVHRVIACLVNARSLRSGADE